MKIKKLRVGPIVGATTDKTVRIFGRAKLQMIDNQPRRAHGVARIRQKGDTLTPEITFVPTPNNEAETLTAKIHLNLGFSPFAIFKSSKYVSLNFLFDHEFVNQGYIIYTVRKR